MIWNKFGYPVAVNYQILNMQGIEWELKPQTENKKAEWRITLDGNNIFTTENWLSADFRWSNLPSKSWSRLYKISSYPYLMVLIICSISYGMGVEYRGSLPAMKIYSHWNFRDSLFRFRSKIMNQNLISEFQLVMCHRVSTVCH